MIRDIPWNTAIRIKNDVLCGGGMVFLKNMVSGFIYGSRALAVIRIALGVLLVYSGFFKALDPAGFGRIVKAYEILPDSLVPYAATVIPYCEMILGVLLAAGYRIKPSSLILMALMAVFSIAIAVNVIRGNSFDCGCFELNRFGIEERISWLLVLRDLALFGVFFLLFIARKHFYALDTEIEKDDLVNL